MKLFVDTSLVDCASFELMRRHGITEALCLDADFAHQGFRLLPSTKTATQSDRQEGTAS